MQRFDSFPSQNESHIDFAMERYQAVFSTNKTDKNGVEIWEGHRMRNRNGHEFDIKFPNIPEDKTLVE